MECIYDIVQQRRSVRAFLPDPVAQPVLDRVLEAACRAPSGGNLQPWHLYVLTGQPLQALKQAIRAPIAAGGRPDDVEYDIYPSQLSAPYRDRRFQVGEALYDALGIARSDKNGRASQLARNFEFFGAPVGLFCYVDRQMGPPQWSDLGMYLQTMMLLLHAEGLGSCPQEAWSLYHRIVAETIQPPPELMLFCGVSIGYPDPAHPSTVLRTERAPLAEVCTFIGPHDEKVRGTEDLKKLP